jgi:serine/threonine protein kinase
MALETIHNDMYHLEEVIANGGFATIYRATAAHERYDVAVKVSRVDADPGYAEALKKEAEVLQKLDHRSIVRLRPIPRSGRADIYYCRAPELPGTPWFFVMEYLAGGTLEQYLQAVGKLTVPEAASIGVEVARALNHTHKQQYTHNDLKLENIVFRTPVQVGHPFTPVLVDFGIAARINPPDGGSLYIMPPEQLSQVKMLTPPENSQVDKTKVDVWGLGVVLYRMLGGLLPFEGRERTMTQRILHSRPTSLQQLSRDIPADMDELIIDGCLAKDPNQRLTIIQLGKELSALADDATALRAPEKKKRWLFG